MKHRDNFTISFTQTSDRYINKKIPMKIYGEVELSPHTLNLGTSWR
jgi:hypothetical protein